MKLIFCSDPLQIRAPDLLYQDEVSAIKSLGLEYELINYEALVDDHPLKAVSRIKSLNSCTLGIYRGWMLPPRSYQQLFEALVDQGIHLINDPDAYKHCHYFPESYSVIESCTPKSVWTKTIGDIATQELMELLHLFNSQPIVVKDFVKSRKHEWQEACYIPSASDISSVERVVRRFIELQGNQLSEGLVFREFIEFERLTQHSKSGMPLTKEFRIFFLDGEPIYTVEYWEEGNYQGITPPIDQFRQIAKSVQSRFFTMDVAKKLDGEWMIIELGDGQVAGLPEKADVLSFYQMLINHLAK
ncbi:hypothetical protein Cylst_2890 [Cylindrospermum stagnale PCC 7417]|uniref:ATP-grasp domain-containing protein n=1 Tax=Cylindrospermum stagnale PCC 7417 TaxID=56107 RepID=K9WY19_9NOST|nr:ATP-grasp domain-containing protein [Cylindrospermum stagnale]AFZ25083.1 hypothetical protein Cylst_2890 [Cylindrospermum stagnale PCC 7417]